MDYRGIDISILQTGRRLFCIGTHLSSNTLTVSFCWTIKKALQAENAWRAAPSFLNPLIAVSYSVIRRPTAKRQGRSSGFPALLATFPYRSIETVAIEAKRVSHALQRKAGVTAAGPLPIFTGFPIKLTHPNPSLIKKMAQCVKVILHTGKASSNVSLSK